MNAVSIVHECLSEKDIELADKFVKRNIENAEYMRRYDDYTRCFFRVDIDKVDENEPTYMIGDKYYQSILTNQYDELVYFYNKEEYENLNKPQQLSLF